MQKKYTQASVHINVNDDQVSYKTFAILNLTEHERIIDTCYG